MTFIKSLMSQHKTNKNYLIEQPYLFMPDLLCQIEMQLWVSVKVEFMMQSRSNGDQIVHSVCNCNANLERVFFED